MLADEFIAARVTIDTKDRFRALAERLELSESVLLRRLIEQSVESDEPPAPGAMVAPPASARDARLSVRLRPDDRLLLAERASARRMPTATYVSVLIRSHLRNLAPLPETELLALRQVLAEMGRVGNALKQIAYAAERGARIAGPDRDGFAAFLKIAESLRDHVRALLKANLESWTKGYTDARG
jgi:hypothetical protein